MAEFVEVMNQFNRMCNSHEGYCDECPMHKACKFYCKNYPFEEPKKSEEIVMDWAKEHPIKTNAEKFKELFGVEAGCLSKCPLYGSELCEKNKICIECIYDEFWEQEYKEPSLDEAVKAMKEALDKHGERLISARIGNYIIMKDSVLKEMK